METTVNSLVEETTEAKNDAIKAATSANEAADKANQAAESIAYKENGFYISHAFLEATDLRYIGFKEIKKRQNLLPAYDGQVLEVFFGHLRGVLGRQIGGLWSVLA